MLATAPLLSSASVAKKPTVTCAYPFLILAGVLGIGCSINGLLRSMTGVVPCPYTEGPIFYAYYQVFIVSDY